MLSGRQIPGGRLRLPEEDTEVRGGTTKQNEYSCGRRSFIATAMSSCALTPYVLLHLGAPGPGSLTKEQRPRMTQSQVIEQLKKGNEHFRTRKMVRRDCLAERDTVAQTPVRLPSTTFAAEVRFWRTWKRRAPSGLPGGSTTSGAAWWSSPADIQ